MAGMAYVQEGMEEGREGGREGGRGRAPAWYVCNAGAITAIYAGAGRPTATTVLAAYIT